MDSRVSFSIPFLSRYWHFDAIQCPPSYWDILKSGKLWNILYEIFFLNIINNDLYNQILKSKERLLRYILFRKIFGSVFIFKGKVDIYDHFILYIMFQRRNIVLTF